MGSQPTQIPDHETNSAATTSSVMGSLSDSRLPFNILSLLRVRQQHKVRLDQVLMPEGLSISQSGHRKAVNAIHWSSSHAFSSSSCFGWAGLDHSVCILNEWSNDQKKARVFNFHDAAVKM